MGRVRFLGPVYLFRYSSKGLGTIVGVISIFLAPALLGLAPWYSGFALGDWFPLLLTYGGGIGASILFAIGSAIDGDR